jgi:thiol-disulfide isomerase/thioredoxin
MRFVKPLLILALASAPLWAQQQASGPTDPKAQKTYKSALEYLHQHETEAALDTFKKADKQDGGHCLDCQNKMIHYGLELGDWKTAEAAAQEIIAEAHDAKSTALAHYQLSAVFFSEAVHRHKDEFFSRSHDELGKALAAAPNFPDAVFADGQALAHLKQDDAAKARFEEFVKLAPDGNPNRQRALRYIADPDLARARMAPAFAVTTLDGQQVSLDDLQGKVVLLDFWATWCEPCREALPHMREIAKKFQGQPLVLLSISLDNNEQKWKDFVAANGMTWLQYRDGGFTGTISRLFNVTAIPHTFTIDADGVLQEEHIGDASIEGKLKKLIARAQEVQTAQRPPQ